MLYNVWTMFGSTLSWITATCCIRQAVGRTRGLKVCLMWGCRMGSF